MATPDLMPILSQGDHPSPTEGACIMEMASYLAGEAWTDKPKCVNPVLAAVAREVNDSLSDADRPAILPLLPRLMATATLQGVDRGLARWCLLHIPEDGDDWWAGWANRHYARGNFEATAESALHCGGGEDSSGEHYVAFLTGLLDEYDRLTGRTSPTPLTADDTARLVALTH